MLAVSLALAASVAWGLADFIAGVKSRTVALLAVSVVSQAAGLAALGAFVAGRAPAPPEARYVALAALAGVCGAVGLTALYRGLAVGAMSVVAPITGTAAAIPVLVGLVAGERPSPGQALGLLFALTGVVLASRQPAAGGRTSRVAAGAGLGVVAALGIGGFLAALDGAGEGGLLWALLVSRVTSLTLLGAAALVVRPRLLLGGRDLASLVAVGALDVSANALFAVAAARGLVSLAAVLASLYPVVTIFLARWVLAERIGRPQQAGVAVALVGVVLITLG